jgi:hypothetical protein
VARTVTYLVELLVGLACLGLAIGSWRHRGALRVAAVLFAVAGVAAVAHAVLELAQ